MYIDRQMQPLLTELQTQFPALLVTGPRQVGKSTLLKHVAPDHHYVASTIRCYASRRMTTPPFSCATIPTA